MVTPVPVPQAEEIAQAVGSTLPSATQDGSSASSSTRSLALIREKCCHFRFIRKRRPSSETATLK